MKKRRSREGPSAASLREIPELDLARMVRGQRGRYAHLLTGEQTHLVTIDEDLWPHFGNAGSVNDALRRYLERSKRSDEPIRRAR